MYLNLRGAVPIPVQSRSMIVMLFTEAEAKSLRLCTVVRSFVPSFMLQPAVKAKRLHASSLFTIARLKDDGRVEEEGHHALCTASRLGGLWGAELT
jgi:hypothetical protein